MYGRGIDALPSSGGLTSVPFPAAGGKIGRKDYDQDLVNAAVTNKQPAEPLDPRDLHSRQSHVRKDIVKHYMTSNEVFADKDQAGNQTPVVYERQPPEGSPSWMTPQRMILSGTHRATAALLRGEQFHAILVKGGYGPPR